MSPPITSTSALWNVPAFRNLRQHTSEPWTSVAKKILIAGTPACGAVRDGPSVVPDLLGQDVPLLAFPDARPELPARRLGRRLDRAPQPRHLVANGVPNRARADVQVG